MMKNGRYGARRAGALMLALFMLLCCFVSMSFAESTSLRGEGDYYLVGNMNNWTESEAYKLTKNEQAENEYMITLDLPANTEMKVKSGSNQWYPDNAGNFTINDAGNYTVYFRPNGDGEGWYHGFIYAEKNTFYSVNVTAGANGAASADHTSATAGTQVTVTVEPDPGYTVDTFTGTPQGWSFNEQTLKGTFQMPAENVNIQVSFKPISTADHTLTVIKSGEGTVTVPATAETGEEVTVSLQAADGYQLRALTVDGTVVTDQLVVATNNNQTVSILDSYTFTMPDHNVTIDAVFEAKLAGTRFVYVRVYGLGTAVPDKTAVATGESSVTITPTPDTGYVFDHIEVVGEGASVSDTTVTVGSGDVIIKVIFNQMPYGITLNSGMQGTLRAIPSTNTAYSGTSVRLIINLNVGCTVDTLTVKTNETPSREIECRLTDAKDQTLYYAFTMPATPVTVTATYRRLAANGYYLIGKNGWTAKDIDPSDRFQVYPDADNQWILTVEGLKASEEVKVVHVDANGKIDAWYPDPGANCQIPANGNYVIYFDQQYHGGNDWHLNCIKLKKIENEFYLADAVEGGGIRVHGQEEEKFYINKEFQPNSVINDKGETIYGLYGSEYEHMLLTWLNEGDKIKVVRKRGNELDWLPTGMGNEYPTWIADTSTQYNSYGVYNEHGHTGMVFVFFEEQLVRYNEQGGVEGVNNYEKGRVDWTNKVFDVQKAYKVDAYGKSSVHPLNPESLTYNLEHGSITLNTGTPFIRSDRENETNIIYELALDQSIVCNIYPEAGYALDGTPYVKYNGEQHDMTRNADGSYSFTMPRADVKIYAPMKKVFRSQSVLLSGQIGVNFFVDLSGHTPDNCRMRFIVGNPVNTNQWHNAELATASSETWASVNPDIHSSLDENRKGFTCNLNAIQMADTIRAELYEQVNGIYYLISVKSYSLQDYVAYFDRTDAPQAQNENSLRVVRAMMDFGYYAQQLKYPGLSVATAADYNYYPAERHYAEVYDEAGILTMLEGHSLDHKVNGETVNKSIPDACGISKVGLQLSVDTATGLLVNLYMDAAPVIQVGPGKTLEIGSDNKPVSLTHGSWTWWLVPCDYYYQVRIEGISAHDLDKQFTIRGTANGATFTIKASAFSYAYNALALTDEAAIELGINATTAHKFGAALYQFHQAEVAYRNATQGNN